MARYFERMKGIVESHGGSEEKFIGDAVMAVFGVPVAQKHDALRACRAAVRMREALLELGIAGMIGVNTGEVGRIRSWRSRASCSRRSVSNGASCNGDGDSRLLRLPNGVERRPLPVRRRRPAPEHYRGPLWPHEVGAPRGSL
jgi:hypothetical protein